MKKILFTDLDGTLLDLHTYSADQVAASVDALKKTDVSIVFCSSKTWAEQDPYLHLLGIKGPAIIENGSAIYLPEGENLEFSGSFESAHKAMKRSSVVLGRPYEEVTSVIQQYEKIFPFELKYYDNTSVDEVMSITGLDREAAEKAKKREFSETLFNVNPIDPNYSVFADKLLEQGFHCIPGSRYITITGVDGDKGKATATLLEAFKKKYGQIMSYGVGDSRNDLEMLQMVKIAYLVQRPDRSWADINLSNLRKVQGIGPAGWNQMAMEILLD